MNYYQTDSYGLILIGILVNPDSYMRFAAQQGSDARSHTAGDQKQA